MLNFLKRNSLLISVFLLLLLIITYWFYWHLKPFTSDAFVFANSRPISPWVEGFITEVKVRNNQFIKKGEVVFTVFREPYLLKIEELTNEIKSKESEIKVLQANLKISEADIRRFQAELLNNRYLRSQAEYMLQQQAVSATYTEEKIRATEISEAQLNAAEFQLIANREKINSLTAQIHKLQNQLELNKIWADLTEVTALNDGYITNLSVSEGGYYRPGDVICGFIDCDQWYIQANFKENELSQIHIGTPAKIWLRQYPGKVFHGVVEEINWGVERREMSQITGIGKVKNNNEYFRLPQRFPVQIRILNTENQNFTLGGSAYVELDIPSHPIRQFFWELFLR